MTTGDIIRAEDNKPAKPKRLRCRASVLRQGEWRSRQCGKAATGTINLLMPNIRTPMPFYVCGTHRKGHLPYAYEPSSKYQADVQEYMA